MTIEEMALYAFTGSVAITFLAAMIVFVVAVFFWRPD
jgi:hypothetical protein